MHPASRAISRRTALRVLGAALSARLPTGTYVTQALAARAPTLSDMEPPVLPGIDVLLQERPDLVRGKRIGLVTNSTGRNAQGQSTIDVLHADDRWTLAALFSPEHGIRGDAAAGENVDSATDPLTGLPIFSLYGSTTRPTAAMLRGLAALVYDIQDVGARVYTYTSTVLELLRAGAEHGVPIVVLDRPDPIGGDQLDGTVLELPFTSFVGPAPIAMRYGMTIGELGHFFNAELDVGADLTVVPMRGWQRSTWFDQTGLVWVNPSPNLRSLAAATVYPGTVLFEGTTLSEGRGTDRPFEWIGAPWMDGAAWADALNAAGLPGVRFEAAERTPSADTAKFPGQRCQGVLMAITDRDAIAPMALSVAMLQAARSVAPTAARITSTFDRLAGTDQLRLFIEAGTSAADIAASWQPALEAFDARRRQYLLY